MEDVSLIYYEILTQSLKAPGAKINRADFLEKNLRNYYSIEQIEKAVTTSTKNAEISEEVIDRVAKSIIKNHTYKVTGTSILVGMPGGLAMVATIPGDLAQFYYHVIVLAQKLAFLYGYPQFDSDDDTDEELFYNLTLFIGVMYDVDGADKAVLAVSRNHATEMLTRVHREALTENAYYILRKNIARWVGIKVTKKTFSQSISKAIPVVSGLASGGVSYFSFTPMARNLRDTLKKGYKYGLNVR